jgi:hypothetical protein
MKHLVWLALLLSTVALADEPRVGMVAAPPATGGTSKVLVVAGDEDVRARLAAGTPDAARADSPAGDATVRAITPLGAAPIQTVIALDQSGSFRDHWKDAFGLARALADASGPGTTTEVVTFGATLQKHGSASDPAALRGVLDKAEAEGALQGYTRLRNFILESVELAETANPLANGGLRQVVVFTDAGEESTAYPVDEVVKRARERGVAVHIVVWQPRGATAARRLDEVKQIAERTGGAFIQTDDLSKAKTSLVRVGSIRDRAFWIELGWCGVPTDQGERLDSTIDVEVWGSTGRLAATGAWPFRQQAAPSATTPCQPVAVVEPPKPEAPAKKWPWWWWLAIPIGLLPLLLLLLLLLRRKPEVAPPPPVEPPAPPPVVAAPPAATATASPFPPAMGAGDDPLERLPEVVLEKVKGPPEAPARLRLHRRTLKVGAAAGSDLRLEIPQISSHHATIQLFPNGNVFIRDEGSTNGTWVGDKKVAAQDREKVQDGSLIAFSRQVTYRVVRPGAAPAAPPPPSSAPPAPPVVEPPPAPKHRTILAPITPPQDPIPKGKPDGEA